jgi:hypothetical protein
MVTILQVSDVILQEWKTMVQPWDLPVTATTCRRDRRHLFDIMGYSLMEW